MISNMKNFELYFMIPDSIPIPHMIPGLNIFDSRTQEWNQKNHFLLNHGSKNGFKRLKKSDSFDSILESVNQKY